jgi:ribose-phosphate pyrophosphokinase
MLKLFSGTANPQLTNEVAKILGIPVSASEVVRFQNSEVRVRIEEDVKNDLCVVIQSTTNPTDTNLMELFLFCDALRRQEAHKVFGIIPCFGYARQDIQHREGECVSANVVIRFAESIGFRKIYTFDIHDEATQGVFTIPYRNLTANSLLADAITKDMGGKVDRKKVTVVSPDQGGIERARKFGESLFGDDKFSVAVIEKKRDQDHIHQSEALDLFGEVEGKTAIIVDDLVTSGSTLIHAAQLCRDRGAKSICAAIVHHDFSNGAAQKIQDSALEKFYTTNTIMLRDEQKFGKLKEISIAPVIAEELKLLQEKD